MDQSWNWAWVAVAGAAGGCLNAAISDNARWLPRSRVDRAARPARLHRHRIIGQHWSLGCLLWRPRHSR
jgi:hypothetical protein